MTLNQKQLKRLKKEVEEYSAFEIGYFNGILSAIPPYALIEAIRELSSNGWVGGKTEDTELQNMLVTEAIKALNYEDFKQVAPYLFSYPKDQREDFFYVQPVEVSRSTYEWLKSQANELFSLKADIEAARESLEAKIEELETDRLPNGDQVIGLDNEARELLLLRSPETSYIDDWQIERKGLLYDYRQSQDYATQTLSYLVGAYPEVKLLVREAILNRDKIDQEVFVDEDFFPQEALRSRLTFRSHQEAYFHGKNYGQFREAFPTYAAYIDATYERHYPTDFALGYHAMTLLPNYLQRINDALAVHGKELVTYTARNEESNDVYYLSYLRDLKTEPLPDVIAYLEHTVGAYFRGSLGELAVIKLDNIDPERGYNGKAERTLFVDHYQLWHHREGNLRTVQSLYPQLSRFVPIEHVRKREYEKETRQPSPGLNI